MNPWLARYRELVVRRDGGEFAAAVEEVITLFNVRRELIEVRPLTATRARQSCLFCRNARFWRSQSGTVTCARCHPPADPRLVESWIKEASDDRPEGRSA